MEHAVAFVVGVTALVAGLSLFLRPHAWLEWVKHLRAQGVSAALMMGYLHLILGTFIVGFHWKWQGWPLLLTLIGAKAIAEGVTYTLFPKAMLAMLAWYEPLHRGWCRVAGLATIVVGLLVLGEWVQHMWPDCTWYPRFNQAKLMME